MVINKIKVKSILNKSQIPGIDYCINPYIGCQHACYYCYSDFMRKYSGHEEAWGDFVDIKINAEEILTKELERKPKKRVLISSVTDPYQPMEKEFKLTRRCLKALLKQQFPISVLTKSTLVERDIDLFQDFEQCEIGITITTDNDHYRRIFEPYAASIDNRLRVLERLKKSQIKTCVFIGPMLPMAPELLAKRLKGLADRVIIDKMNYLYKVKELYKVYKFEYTSTKEYFRKTEKRLKEALAKT